MRLLPRLRNVVPAALCPLSKLALLRSVDGFHGLLLVAFSLELDASLAPTGAPLRFRNFSLCNAPYVRKPFHPGSLLKYESFVMYPEVGSGALLRYALHRFDLTFGALHGKKRKARNTQRRACGAPSVRFPVHFVNKSARG